ncbi:MAG TPA: DsbA family protein [Alphaproteobacteria bacterium]|jgi:protein-disulfide isomerase|nr:DsbA family protein [Alphaproteobacteria bacterium]
MASEDSSKSNLFEKLAPVLLILSVGLAFMVGVLWQKVANLEKNGGNALGANTAAQPAAQATIDIATIKGLFDKNVIKIGDQNKKLIIVEAADPSCPWCHVAGGKDPELYTQMGVANGYIAPVPELKKLVESGKAAFVYIFYPGHGNGEMGAKALYCAQEAGKFWEVHDLVMSNAGYNLMNNTIKNDKTQSGALADFLKKAEDPSVMKKCLDSGKYDAVLKENTDLAASLGVTGTPGFFLNTTSFPGAVDYSSMKSAVDEALK